MAHQTILIVDDEDYICQLLEEHLKDEYIIIKASNGQEAFEKMQLVLPDLIILDINMPVMDGITFLQKFSTMPQKNRVPVAVLTAYSERKTRLKALSLGCQDFLNKPIDLVELQLRVKNILELKTYRDELEKLVEKRTQALHKAYEELKLTQLEIVRRLGKAAEFRDDETGDHIMRTSKYVYIIAKKLGLSAKQCELLSHASPMHDIGKIGIPDSILLKPGKLTPEEFEIIKLHTLIGAEILAGTDLPLLKLASEIALTHHERWDGTGYPSGLKGEEIPLSGRIMALADTFDSLINPRIYKKEWELERAKTHIKNERGKHFDPKVVDAFFAGLDEIIAVRDQWKGEEQPKLMELMEKVKELKRQSAL